MWLFHGKRLSEAVNNPTVHGQPLGVGFTKDHTS